MNAEVMFWCPRIIKSKTEWMKARTICHVFNQDTRDSNSHENSLPNFYRHQFCNRNEKNSIFSNENGEHFENK